MTNGNTDVFEEVLSRVSPPSRDAFLKSSAELRRRFDANDEVLAIAMHLDSFACVIGELAPQTISAAELTDCKTAILRLVDSTKTLESRFARIEASANHLHDISRFHLAVFGIVCFIIGAICWLSVELITAHFHYS